jgi:ABC-type sugar transport system permease subunit
MKSIVSELIIGVGLSIIYDNNLRFYFDEEQNLILLLLLLLVVVVVVVVWNNILK